ncbi:hypothetical protein HD593_009616 [Nonomuraea rubra]|uniref:Uncharacterized protein n=1 Tax=Nonomuraea rubra TaxID=46180 RepID=A0A7X0U4G9_9ACTN|nr:hypothetical protein [Nonomuraea rubra]
MSGPVLIEVTEHRLFHRDELGMADRRRHSLQRTYPLDETPLQRHVIPLDVVGQVGMPSPFAPRS